MAVDWKTRYLASVSARSFILGAVAKAHGWSGAIDSTRGERCLGEHIYLYSVDAESGFLWVEIESRSDFIDAMQASYEKQTLWEIERIALNVALWKKGQMQTDSQESDMRLAPLIAAYVGTTGLALDPEQIPRDSHLFLLRYPNNPPEMPVRICLAEINGMDTVMSAAMAKEAVEKIVADDRNSNPEWFVSDET